MLLKFDKQWYVMVMVRLPAKLKYIVENEDVANTIFNSDAYSPLESTISIEPSVSAWTVLLFRLKRMSLFLLLRYAVLLKRVEVIAVGL